MPKNMPYGLPKGKDTPENNKKMESCVKKLMAQGKSKESAIRICKSSITGGKTKKTDEFTITINIDSKTLMEKAHSAIVEEISKQISESLEYPNRKEVKKEQNNMSKKIVKLADMFNADELEKMDDKMKECIKAALAEGKSKDEAMKSCGMKAKKADEATDVAKADGDEPEEKAEEVKEEAETAEEPKEEAEGASSESEDEVEEEETEEEDEGEVQKELDPIEVLKAVSEMEDPKEIREAITKALSQLVKTDDKGNQTQASNIGVDVKATLDAILERLNVIEGLAKANEDAEATKAEEGDGAEEETSEEASTEGEQPADEAETEESSEDTSADESDEDEGTDVQKLEKVENDVLAKVDEKLTPIADAIEKLTKTVETLSKSAAQSKIKSPSVVAKSFGGDENEAKERIAKINEELSELEKVRDNNPSRYQSQNLADRAFELLNERERLQLGL